VTRRLVLVAIGVLVALPTAAAAGDMEEMLDSGDGSFVASGVVTCTWGEDTATASYEITRSDGMSMVYGPDGDLMLSGALAAAWSGDTAGAFELGGWGDWEMSDRYEVTEGATTMLDRPATEALVTEGGVLRVRLVVDDETSVPLLTEVFDADGSPYRVASLVEFAAGAPDMDMPDDMPEHEMLMPSDGSPWLPTDANGYRRVDTYRMGKTNQVFYSDGLFSFSVFETRIGPRPAEFDGATGFVVDGEIYRRVVTPTVVWVHWDAPDHSYVLVGDLPPDHLVGVLEELPEPGRRNLLVRIWRRLFG
jgi:hypothetical protein